MNHFCLSVLHVQSSCCRPIIHLTVSEVVIMSAPFWFTLLTLSFLNAASDPDCEELTKPLQDQTTLMGKWILHAATSDNEQFLKEIKTIRNTWIEMLFVSDDDVFTMRWGEKRNDKCYHGQLNATFFTGNSSRISFHFNSSHHEHVGTHLESCPDCILWADQLQVITDSKQTTTGRSLYLFTKSGKVETSHMEGFKKQAECLNFPPEFHFGESTDLCPVEDADPKAEEQ
ncbi:uncharacterized protein LOC117509779 [Thalassophryne amazonica]|uniref:uncharacterized protein LOC117509779 n=1 Tax=Thalassophryne amazonica TaxID=390379 RepID=UPI0014712085|nr:uncharacterized protein LOC117509779 [Thalassophryne amazonica]